MRSSSMDTYRVLSIYRSFDFLIPTYGAIEPY